MEHLALSPLILVSDLLAESPLIAPLLIELRVDCIGCSMNKFCTLADLCDQYHLELKILMDKIQERLIDHASN
jgi:hypothetical protein